MQTYIVHAHGRELADKFRVPNDTIIYRMCKPGFFYYDDVFTHDIWHFSLQKMHDKLKLFTGSDMELKETLEDYFTNMNAILGMMDNEFCSFSPGQIIPNVLFKFKDPDFSCGVFKFPMKPKYIKGDAGQLTKETSPDDPHFHDIMHHITSPLEAVFKSDKHKFTPDLKSLVSSISNNSGKLKVIFLMTCTESSAEQTLMQTYNPLHNYPKNIKLIMKSYNNLVNYTYETTDKATINDIVSKMGKLHVEKKRKAKNDLILPSSKRVRVYNVRSVAKRPFIRVKRTKWYLDEHRGQYRYDDAEQSKLHIIGPQSI
jgi:hypothetical protein